MKSRWISHKGKRIFYMDFSGFGLDVAGVKAEIDATTEVTIQQPEKSVLGLTDMRGTTISSEVAELFKSNGAIVQKYFRKQALVGMSGGFRMVIFQAVSRVIGVQGKLFDDPEPAKDWLVSAD
jgi:hypothetical protein